MKEVLRSFESMKRNIKNNIYHNETMMFNECDKNSNDIKSVYKSF